MVSDGNGTHEHPPPYDMPPEARELAPGVRPGRVEPGSHREGSKGNLYQSRIFDGWSFRHWLYVPAAYDPKKPAALLVAQDGGMFIGSANLRTDTVLDNLIERGEVPPTIGLFIDPGGPAADGTYEDVHRSEAYDTVSDRYARFLIDEIVPDVVQSKYAISAEPEDWCVAGFSSGGIAAFSAAWFRPDRFRKVFTINGSFTPLAQRKTQKSIGGDAYPRMIRDSDRKPLRITLLSGTHDIDSEIGNWLAANDEMARALADKGYSYRYLRGEGHHYVHEIGPDQGAADLPNALRWLWQDYGRAR